ncbi:MAG: chlorite dismutase family protein [Gammaproteobacteria bacterium]|nr:chlorite dismutase family protein [Gammaproteobacteria bacterium]
MSSEERRPPDMAEKGRRDGRPISLDRRLFMNFTAWEGPADAAADALAAAGIEGALYEDVSDPHGIGIIAMAEEPTVFVTTLRELFNADPFSAMVRKPEFDMLGRTYSIGYESDLEEVLFDRPRGRVLNPELTWAIWYPLQRSKSFYRLSEDRQREILGEHGTIGRRYGEAGLAADVRLACHGLDRDDNDFVIGLLGAELHPLSALVREMRATEQTSQYLDRLGPFFVGRVAWQSGSR